MSSDSLPGNVEDKEASPELIRNAPDDVRSGVRDAVSDALSPEHERRMELSRRRESKELSPFDFDLNFIFQLNEAGQPLARRDLTHQTGTQAVVLTREDLETLGGFTYVDRSGALIDVESESVPHELILFPEDVGNEQEGTEM